jgi:hypothetical protein
MFICKLPQKQSNFGTVRTQRLEKDCNSANAFVTRQIQVVVLQWVMRCKFNLAPPEAGLQNTNVTFQ